MANKNRNRNKPQDEEFSLEAFLMEKQVEDRKARSLDLKFMDAQVANGTALLTTMQLLYTPLAETQNILMDFKTSQTANRRHSAEREKLLKENISQTKSLYKLLETQFDPNKKQHQVASKAGNQKDKKANTNFDDKSRHERGILGETNEVVPLLRSIKDDTSEIVKLLKAQNKSEIEPPKQKDTSSIFDKLPSWTKFLPLVIPLAAAAVAVRHTESANAVKAGLGVATAGARLATPIIEGARAGASSASGLSKIASAIAGARTAVSAGSWKDGFRGPANVGTLGKVGAGLGAGATLGRAMEGDTAGATAQGISTLLPLLLAKTKYGKLAGMASAGIDVGLIGRDYLRFQDKKAEAEAKGETVLSPAERVKKDVNTVSSFFGFGSKADEKNNPVAQNTQTTNEILQKIHDEKSFANPPVNKNEMIGPLALGTLGAGALALLSRGRLGAGIASTGLGQRLMGGLATARSTAGMVGNTARSGLDLVRGAPAMAGGLARSGGMAVAKGAGKMVGKLIPGVGLVMGAVGAYDKLKEGDYKGALLEGGSGIASLLPGIGTAVAIGLQGISATRDVMKATNDQTQAQILSNNANLTKSLTSSTNENNEMIKSSNATLSASILASSALTNKSITDTSKTANDSLVTSANTLTSTGSTLSNMLTSASNTLLSMIGKWTPTGMAMQGAQAIGGWIGGGINGMINGSAPTPNALAQGHDNLHSTRKNNMMTVYQSLVKAGMNDNQARIMTAEIGRENSFGNNLWKAHNDPHKGVNVGMMSWQGSRGKNLLKFMGERGLLNPDGSIQRSQKAIDAQAEFIMQEMRSGEFSGIGRKFLDNKDISYAQGAELLGKDYIKWRYTDPAYANGHKNRDGFYADINSELNKRGVHGISAQAKENKKTYVSQKEFDKLSKPIAKPPMMASQQIQQKYQKDEADRVKKLSTIQKGLVSGSHVIGTAPKQQANNVAIPYAKQPTKDEGSTSPINNKEFYNIGVQNVVVNKGVDMAGLQPPCRDAFFTMIGDLYANKGAKGKAVVSSAFRSTAQQQALFDAELKKQGGDESKARKNVAKPGNSKHEKGLALDVDRNTVRALETSGLLAKYNFSRPLAHEPWHIEFGSGSAVSASGSALLGSVANLAENPDFENLALVGENAINFAAQGLSAMLSGPALDSMREFMKSGTIDKPKDRNPIPKAQGTFTKDESDPTVKMAKDNGNGDFWDNLDQQLGDGTLKRQERNQAEYDKVKKIFGGRQGIFRQIGGKYGWLSEVFGGLFGEDNLLSDVFGILTGSQDIAGLPKILDKTITGRNKSLDQIGVMGGGFGGGLSSNNKDTYAITAQDQIDTSTTPIVTDGGILYAPTGAVPSGAFGGGFGGGLSQNNESTPQGYGYNSEPVFETGLGTLSGLDLDQMGAVGGGFGGGRGNGSISYDDSMSKYEDQEFEQAKYYQQKMEDDRMKMEISIPTPTQTQTAQAPSGGKSSQSGLGGNPYTWNTDSIIQMIAKEFLGSSVR